MRFESPEMLWVLAVLTPLLIAFFWWAWIKRRRLILQFVQARLLAQLTVGVSTGRQKLRMVLLAMAVIFLLLALARPQLGFDWEEARQRGLDVVVAIDTSRSMLAEDLAPNRLLRAKLAALDLRRLARTDRLALVAFAGTAFLQCPLTLDDEAFRQSVEALDVNIIPQGGTALAEAIQTALKAFKEGEDNFKVLVLFTDGEDHDGQAVEVARQAAGEGMRIFTVGVGTKNGELLRVTDPQGRTEYIKDEQGQVVKSRLDEKMLQGIADAAQGFYLLLSGTDTMALLYERGLAPLPKSEFASRQVRRYHERFQWPLGVALIILIVEVFMPERKRTRRGETPAVNPIRTASRVAIFLVLLGCVGNVTASPRSALQKYQVGQYVASQLEFERALEKNPKDARLAFNAGAAAFQARDYERARQHFEKALVGPDLKLQEQAFYNLGNAQFRMGESVSEPTGKQQAWQEAVTSYQSALKLDPKDQDAQYNLDVVRKRLEELQKQQQQQQQQNQDQNKDNKDNKDEKDQQQQQDQQSDQNKDQQSQEEQNKESEQKSQDQQQEQQQQEQKDQKGEQQQQAKPEQGEEKKGSKGEQQPEGKPEDQEGSMMQVQMTPEQAKQLLDTLRSEERPLIFVPDKNPRQRTRSTKNW